MAEKTTSIEVLVKGLTKDQILELVTNGDFLTKTREVKSEIAEKRRADAEKAEKMRTEIANTISDVGKKMFEELEKKYQVTSITLKRNLENNSIDTKFRSPLIKSRGNGNANTNDPFYGVSAPRWLESKGYKVETTKANDGKVSNKITDPKGGEYRTASVAGWCKVHNLLPV